MYSNKINKIKSGIRKKIKSKNKLSLYDRYNESIIEAYSLGFTKDEIVDCIIKNEQAISSVAGILILQWFASFLLKQFIVWLVRRLYDDLSKESIPQAPEILAPQKPPSKSYPIKFY